MELMRNCSILSVLFLLSIFLEGKSWKVMRVERLCILDFGRVIFNQNSRSKFNLSGWISKVGDGKGFLYIKREMVWKVSFLVCVRASLCIIEDLAGKSTEVRDLGYNGWTLRHCYADKNYEYGSLSHFDASAPWNAMAAH